MEIEEIKVFKFTYTPVKKGVVRQAIFIIVAKDKEEAKDISMREFYNFFDQDMNVGMEEILTGYRQKDSNGKNRTRPQV